MMNAPMSYEERLAQLRKQLNNIESMLNDSRAATKRLTRSRRIVEKAIKDYVENRDLFEG